MNIRISVFEMRTPYVTILLVPILPVTTLLATILPCDHFTCDHITCDYFTLWPNYCRPNYCDHITVDQITAHLCTAPSTVIFFLNFFGSMCSQILCCILQTWRCTNGRCGKTINLRNGSFLERSHWRFGSSWTVCTGGHWACQVRSGIGV